MGWLPRPGLSLSAFAFFGRNLFYSTSAAAALIIVAVFAWAVAWRKAAFATALAVLPVVAVWVVSQGPYSYFFPRYLLLTTGAWALLTGVALSRLEVRVAVAAVLVFGILGAGDQLVIREPGAHNRAMYPVSGGDIYWDYAAAASVIARQVRPGDGIVYPGDRDRWLMTDVGTQYYLDRDLPAALVPREVFVSGSAAEAGTLYSKLCNHPVRCLGGTARVWVVSLARARTPYGHIPAAQSAAMRPHYRVKLTKRVPGLTVFLLVQRGQECPRGHPQARAPLGSGLRQVAGDEHAAQVDEDRFAGTGYGHGSGSHGLEARSAADLAGSAVRGQPHVLGLSCISAAIRVYE